MRVLLSTIGSRGDVQPLVALASAVRALGHEARFCVPPDFREWIEGLGFPVVPIGPEVRQAAVARPRVASAPPSPTRSTTPPACACATTPSRSTSSSITCRRSRRSLPTVGRALRPPCLKKSGRRKACPTTKLAPAPRQARGPELACRELVESVERVRRPKFQAASRQGRQGRNGLV